MDFLFYIILAVIAFYAGWHFRGVIMLANLAVNPDKIIKMLENIKKINEAEARGEEFQDGIEVESEQVGNVWYAYDKDTGHFLAQGTSFEDALKAACDRFPEKTFWCKKPEQFNQTA
jgi:hypothetical protein